MELYRLLHRFATQNYIIALFLIINCLMVQFIDWLVNKLANMLMCIVCSGNILYCITEDNEKQTCLHWDILAYHLDATFCFGEG